MMVIDDGDDVGLVRMVVVLVLCNSFTQFHTFNAKLF